MALIEIGHWATAEITKLEGLDKVLIITDETLNSIHIPLEAARNLYSALRTFDLSGELMEEPTDANL